MSASIEALARIDELAANIFHDELVRAFGLGEVEPAADLAAPNESGNATMSPSAGTLGPWIGVAKDIKWGAVESVNRCHTVGTPAERSAFSLALSPKPPCSNDRGPTRIEDGEQRRNAALATIRKILAGELECPRERFRCIRRKMVLDVFHEAEDRRPSVNAPQFVGWHYDALLEEGEVVLHRVW